MTLEPCDIFLVRGQGLVRSMIRFFTRRIGESPTRVNHVGIMVTPTDVVEALSRVKRRPFLSAYRGKTVAIYRPLSLSPAEKAVITSRATEYVGRPYGYLKIVTHTLDWALQGAFVFRRLTQSPRYPICSWVVAESYAAAGLNFGVAAGAASPDDIWDFVTRHPSKYECIHPLSPI